MPSPSPLPPGERRPIASRERAPFKALAALLVRARVSANAISILGMFMGAAAGVCLLATANSSGVNQRVLFLLAAAAIQLRLLANMLDGMVAIASGTSSPAGELYNEIPDRISDTLILAGAGYAAGGDPALGWVAACAALFVTYIRAVGKTLGITGLFIGPMSKSHRMFVLTVACLFLGLAPDAWHPLWQLVWPREAVGIMAAVLALIVVGCLLTALRRLHRIVQVLREKP